MSQARRSSAFLSAQKGDVDRLRREAEAAFQLLMKRIDDLEGSTDELEEDVDDLEEAVDAAVPLNAPFITHAISGALTNERVLVDGTNTTVNTGVAGQVSIDASGGPTDEEVRDLVGAMCADSATVTLTHNDGADTVTAAVVAGSIDTTQLADDAVTFAKLQNIASGRVLGRTTAAAGSVEELDVSGLLSLTTAGFLSTRIATNRLAGRSTAGSGVLEAITPDATLLLSGGSIGVVEESLAVVRSLSTITSDIDVVSTASETAILDYTVRANTVPAGGRVRVDIGGDHRNNTGGNQFWTIRILLNGVEVWQDNTQQYTSNGARRAWRMVLTFTRKSASTGFMHGEYNSCTTATQPDTGLGPSTSDSATGTPISSGVTDIAGLDWTADQALQVLITPSANNANLSFAVRGGGVEVIP